MIENTLGARVGARASARGANFRPPLLKDVAHILLAICALGSAALLFFGWLMDSNPPRPTISGSGAGLDCISLGRGGVYCAKHLAADSRSNASSGPQNDCASLGKGGRICTEHP
jgi:hypothetical protein